MRLLCWYPRCVNAVGMKALHGCLTKKVEVAWTCPTTRCNIIYEGCCVGGGLVLSFNTAGAVVGLNALGLAGCTAQGCNIGWSKKKKKAKKGFLRTYPKVSSSLFFASYFFFGTSPLFTEKMDVVALNNAAFRGPGWIACKRGDWFQCSPWTEAFGVWW